MDEIDEKIKILIAMANNKELMAKWDYEYYHCPPNNYGLHGIVPNCVCLSWAEHRAYENLEYWKCVISDDANQKLKEAEKTYAIEHRKTQHLRDKNYYCLRQVPLEEQLDPENAPGIMMARAKKLLESAQSDSYPGLFSIICGKLSRFFGRFA